MKAHPEQERFGEASYHSCAVPQLSLHETPVPSLPGAGDTNRTASFPIALTCKDFPVGSFHSRARRTFLGPNLHRIPTIDPPRRTRRTGGDISCRAAHFLARTGGGAGTAGRRGRLGPFPEGACNPTASALMQKPASRKGEAGFGLATTSRRSRSPEGSWGRPGSWETALPAPPAR